ncbi:MAG: glycosyltransferase family 39 protein [Chloroflexi bacterium]|nr:glycosyltransferase family 39 protein [Chloroflexota bacterium]
MIDESQRAPILGTWQERLLPILLLAILLLATAVRFHRLGEQSLWYDEGVAYAHSLRTLPELIPLLQRNVHVPAYFTLLSWWQDLTGSSEFALRALSALFSIVSVAWTYALGKRLFHPGAGLAAAALVALNSFSIYYAQEARMYAMLAAIAGGSMWLFVGLHVSPPKRRWLSVIVLGLLNGLGLYTHVAYALIILAQAVLAAIWLGLSHYRARQDQGLTNHAVTLLIQFALSNLLTLLLFAPWLPVSLQQILAQPNLAQVMPLDQTLRQILGYFAYGNTFELNFRDMTFFVYAFLLFGLIPAVIRSRTLWNIALPVVWVIVSIAVYLTLGLTTRYLRFLLPAQMAFALWLGRGVWMAWMLHRRHRVARWRDKAKFAVVLAAAFSALPLIGNLGLVYHDSRFQRDDVRGLVERIESELREGDAVLVSAAGLQEVLSYYYRGNAPVYGLPTSADAGDTASAVLQITLIHRRIFAIFYGSEEQDPKRAVEINLNAHSYQASQEWVGDIRFARFIVPDESFNERHSPDAPFGDVIRLAHYWTSAKPVARGEYLLVGIFWLANGVPETRYKVFVQLLDSEGRLVAQRDSEPAGGTWPTISWEAGYNYYDYHALLIPETLPSGDYTLIAGLYDINDPAARLPVGDSSYVELGTIEVADAG